MKNSIRFHQILYYERERRGWSQEELAAKVGVDTKTVRRWEKGSSLPHPYARQRLSKVLEKSIQELGLVDEKAVSATPLSSPTDNQETEILAHQAAERASIEDLLPAESFFGATLEEDWGEAPRIGYVYGRSRERDHLLQWLQDDSCHVISIVGMGGIGKTTLAALVATHTRDTYPYLFWRSLHNAPPLELFLKNCIRFLSHQQQILLPDTEDELVALLLHYLRHRHCLLILDNFESILQPQQRAGLYQKGYEGYGRLIQRLGETQHNSCLLLISRDKPAEIAQLEGHLSPVRSFSLRGIDVSEGQAILQEKELVGSDAEWSELIRHYAGNPLALKLISEPIQEVFGGSLSRFLTDGTFAFGDLDDVLEQQIDRLTSQEKDILTWLSIEREAVSLEELRDDLLQQVQKSELVEALASLRRRSLVETRRPTSFTLLPVIMEYMTTRLIKRLVDEFQEETSTTWISYALLKAQGKDYVRESQIRVLLEPVARRLLDIFGREGLEHRLQEQLATQRQFHPLQQSYRAGNILNLLIVLGYDLHGFDFSHVMIRQAYLQNALLPEVNFASAHFVASVFTNTFGNILSVAFSADGNLLAAGTATGDIWVYTTVDESPYVRCTGHTDGVWAVTFSPDHLLLVSSSDDATMRVWNVSTGECLAILRDHHERIRAVAFDSEGKMLVSGSDDGTIRLWEVQTGQCRQVLRGHTGRVWAVALHGDILASGSTDHTIRLWDINARQCLTVLQGHTNSIRSLSFHPDGSLLASGSDDQTIRLWNRASATEIRVFSGHTNRVWSVAFSHDGQWLASGSEDKTIRIWEVQTGQCLRILHGHAHGVRSVAFSSQDLLASGGDDQTTRLWNIRTGHCLRTFQGYTNRIWSVFFRPDGRQLLSSSEDHSISLWDIYTAKCNRSIVEHNHAVRCVAYSPDGLSCASGGEDQTIRLWNLTTGQVRETFRGHTDWIRAIAFHPDGHMLASGGEDHTIRLWDIHSGLCLYTLKGHTSWVRGIAFSTDGGTLATCGDDATIRLWDSISGSPMSILKGHTDRIRSIAFHPEKPLLVSGGEDHTIRLWDTATGLCSAMLQAHAGRIRSVAFSPDGQTFASSGEDYAIHLWNTSDVQRLLTLHSHTKTRWISFHPRGELLASSGDDGSIQLWHLPDGRCLQTLLSERPYEGMNITSIQGVTTAQKESLLLLGAVEDAYS